MLRQPDAARNPFEAAAEAGGTGRITDALRESGPDLLPDTVSALLAACPVAAATIRYEIPHAAGPDATAGGEPAKTGTFAAPNLKNVKVLSLTAAGFLAGAAAVAGTVAATVHRDPRPSAFLIRGVFSGAGKLQPFRNRPAKDSITGHRGLRYMGTSVDPSLDLFLPEGATEPLPVVVWVHGGAWISGSKKDVEPYLRVLAGYGYAVVGVGYSISPKASYPTAIRELNTALGYLREHAGTYGLDPDRIVLAGDSAGAQLAAQLALEITNPGYARLTGVTPAAAPEHLRGILLNCGVYDFQSVAKLPGTFGWGLRKALWAYTGSKDWASTDAAEHMSIFDHVNGQFPPTYIAAGNGDPLTSSQSIPLADRLQELGVPVTRRFWPQDYKPSLGHEYQFRLDRPEAQQTLKETVRFLDTVTRQSAPADRSRRPGTERPVPAQPERVLHHKKVKASA